MKFLGIDTSGARLTVIARNGKTAVLRSKECAMRHSVLLMEEIEGALREAGLSLSECDFLACAVGPGSFTGVRIGISTVKGLCLAAEKPALAVTSFECLAYADTRGKRLALIDAGKGCFYAQPFEDDLPLAPAFLSGEGVAELERAGYRAIGNADPAEGFLRAAEALAGRAAPAGELTALYLRKSAAEEGR